MNKTVKCVLCAILALYFGRLAIQGWTSDQACSFVHPLLSTSDESGCVDRHMKSFVYWKRVLFYTSITIVSLCYVVLAIGKPPGPPET